MAQLLITEDYLKKTTVIGDNVDMKILTPVIEWVQDIYILPLLGADLYDQIITQSTPTTTLTAANSTLLNTYILKAMRFYILAESVRTFKYRYTNQGIMIGTSQNGTAIPYDEMEALIDEWKSKAETYGELMINYIYDNQASYPAYWTLSGVYRERPRATAYDSPISFFTGTKREGPNDSGDYRYKHGWTKRI